MTLNNLLKKSLVVLSFLFVFYPAFSQTNPTDFPSDNAKKPTLNEIPEILDINQLCPQEFIWQNIQPGFEKTSFKINILNVTWTCVKIDLNTPNLKIAIEPSCKENLGQNFWLKQFARKYKTIAAINTTPFAIHETDYPIGITKFNNQEITAPSKNYCALLLNLENTDQPKAKIISQKDYDGQGWEHAVGGFFITHINDEFITFDKGRRSRVGCGLSSDGNTLFLMVVTPVFSLDDQNGLNYEECARIFSKMGCTSSMQFDGGHSSGLYVKNHSEEAPMFQRQVPTAMGFYIAE